MTLLATGLALFFAAHLFTTLRAPRAAAIARLGEGGYKAAYSALSLAGLLLIILGFGRANASGLVWSPPLWTHDLTVGLMWLAFICFACAGKQPSRIRGWLRHPMLAGVMLWAFAHLLANGQRAAIVLFGAFLAWAIYDRIAVERRGDPGAPELGHFTRADAVALLAGTAVFVLVFWLHRYIAGVPVILG